MQVIRYRSMRLHGIAAVIVAVVALKPVAAQNSAAAAESPTPGVSVQDHESIPVLQWKFARTRGLGDDRDVVILFHRVLETLRTKPADEVPWENVLHDLAYLLDRKRDLHLELDDRPDGPPRPVFPGQPRRVKTVSMWTTVDQLIGELPPAGRREWVNLRGAAAARALKDAVAAGDVNGLREVARRFVHTAAGYEAVERVGTHHLDRGAMVLAVRQLEKLRRYPQARQSREPMLTLKASAGWAAIGRQDRAFELLVELDGWLDENPNADPNRFALLREPLETRIRLLQTLAGRRVAAGPNNLEWTHFLGNPQRTGQAAFSPVGELQWTSFGSGFESRPADTDRAKFTPQAVLAMGEQGEEVFPTSEAEMVAFIEAGLEWLDGYDVRNDQWQMPAGYPLIVGDLAIFRTFNRVRAVDLKTGEIRWEPFMTDLAWEEQFDLGTAEAVTRLPKQQVHLFSPLNQRQNEFVRIRSRHDRTTGTMSSDGQHLFYIEDCGVPSSVTSNATQSRLNRTGPMPWNRLLCADVQSGLLEWELGGPNSPKPLPAAGYFFLGPPTVVDGKAYALGEFNGRVRLFCLQPKTGEIEWSQDIADTHFPTTLHGLRRTVGASPTEASGLLICPLVDGQVVAVDPDLRSTAWTWRYSGQQPASQRSNFQRRMVFRAGPATPHVPPGERWRDLAVMDAGGLVVITPPDAHSMYCIDIVTGKNVWSAPRGKGLYLATVYDNSVVVVDSDKVRGLSLADGAELWQIEFDQRLPCGRGLRAGHVLQIPMRTVPVSASEPAANGIDPTTDAFASVNSRGLIASIDLKSGRLLVETETPDGRPPGNLVAADGVLVSQRYGEVIAMQSQREVEEQLAARVQNPNDAVAALTDLARLRLHQGETTEAVQHLKSAVTQNPRAIPSELVLRTVMLEIQSSGSAESELLRLFDSVRLSPPDQIALTRLRTDLLLQNQQVVDAFNLLIQTRVGQEASGVMLSSEELTQAAPQWRAALLGDFYSRMSEEQRLGVSGFEPDLTSPEKMRDWLSAFGSLSGAAPAVRLKLADTLDPQTDLLEIEELLTIAMAEGSDASAEIARNSAWLTAGQGDAVVAASTEFRRRWKGRQLPGDASVADVVGKWLQHDTVRNRPAPVVWPASATVRVIENNPDSQPADENAAAAMQFDVPVVGVPSLAIDGWLFGISAAGVSARDGSGRTLWTIGPEEFPNIEFPQMNRRPAAYVISDGHLLAVMLGTGFSVFDISSAKPERLWTRGLLDVSDTGLPTVRQLYPGPNMARRVPALFLSSSRLVGVIDQLAGGCLVYRTQNTLHCVNARSGRLQWRRSGTRVSDRLSSDGRHLTITDYDGLRINTLQVLDLHTGRKIQDTSSVGGNADDPLKNFSLWGSAGRNLVGRRRAVLHAPVECHDPVTGKRLWQHQLTTPDGGFWMPCARNLLVGLDAAGKLKVCDMTTGNLLVDTQVPPTPNLQSLDIHETDFGLVVFAPAKFERLQVGSTVRSAVHATFVGGLAHAVDIDNREVLWTQELPQQFATLPQPRDLPVLVLRSRRTARPGATIGQAATVDYPVSFLDVRTGELMETLSEKLQSPDPHPTVDVDSREIRYRLNGVRQAVIDFRTVTNAESQD